jgi:hypothetical protein
MKRALLSLTVPLLLLVVSPKKAAASDDGAPQISVETNGGIWRVIGGKHRLEFNATNLACRVETPGNAWQMRDSSDGDLRVRHGTNTVSLRLASAGRKDLAAYENGFQKGLKLELSEFRSDTNALDLSLQLFLCFEGGA